MSTPENQQAEKKLALWNLARIHTLLHDPCVKWLAHECVSKLGSSYARIDKSALESK
jgi:hypothetical protein